MPGNESFPTTEWAALKENVFPKVKVSRKAAWSFLWMLLGWFLHHKQNEFWVYISVQLPCNKVPQYYQLKTIQIYYITASRGQESGYELARSYQVQVKESTDSGVSWVAWGHLPGSLRLLAELSSLQLLDWSPRFLASRCPGVLLSS